MLDVGIIDDPAAATVALDPVRSRLLAELAEPASAATLAARLGIARQKVNYHPRALEAHRLVRVAGERRRGGLTERLLEATAAASVVSPGALGPAAADPGREADRLSAGYVIALAARYHDTTAPDGRSHRLVVVAHPARNRREPRSRNEREEGAVGPPVRVGRGRGARHAGGGLAGHRDGAGRVGLVRPDRGPRRRHDRVELRPGDGVGGDADRVGPAAAVRHGWPWFFEILNLYLTHFRGERCSTIRAMGAAPGPAAAAWDAVTTALGVAGAAPGGRVVAPAGLPPLAGVVERAGETKDHHALILRVDAPCPGIVSVVAPVHGGQVVVALDFHLYGDRAADVAVRDEPAWQRWMGERFPFGGFGSGAG
jgi:hypothetical protein